VARRPVVSGRRRELRCRRRHGIRCGRRRERRRRRCGSNSVLQTVTFLQEPFLQEPGHFEARTMLDLSRRRAHDGDDPASLPEPTVFKTAPRRSSKDGPSRRPFSTAVSTAFSRLPSSTVS
jgi:hypothetical protein